MEQYLGPKWLPKRNFPYRKEFNVSARVHDWNYELKEKPRIISDYIFFKQMLDDCARERGNKRIKMFVFAILYYVLVFLFGRISFYIL